MILSPFQISLFLQCPLKYRLQYVDGLSQEFHRPRSYFSFGRTVHAALRDFYRLGGPAQNPFPLLYQLYRNQWQGIDPVQLGYRDREEAEDYYYRGYYMLQHYYRAHEEENRKTLYLEEFFQGEILPGMILGGRIDRVAETPDGWVDIIDYKTGKRVPREEDLKEDIQPAVYQYLVKKALQTEKVRICSYYLFKKKTLLLEELDLGEEELMELTQTIREQIDQKVFPSQKNRFCSFCDYQILCPQQMEKWELMGQRSRDQIVELARSHIYESPILFLQAGLLALEEENGTTARKFFQEVEKRKGELSPEQALLFHLKQAQLYLKEGERELAQALLLEIESLQQEGVTLPGSDYLLEWLQLRLNKE